MISLFQGPTRRHHLSQNCVPTTSLHLPSLRFFPPNDPALNPITSSSHCLQECASSLSAEKASLYPAFSLPQGDLLGALHRPLPFTEIHLATDTVLLQTKSKSLFSILTPYCASIWDTVMLALCFEGPLLLILLSTQPPFQWGLGEASPRHVHLRCPFICISYLD